METDVSLSRSTFFHRLLTMVLAILASTALPSTAAELNVYSARKEALIKPLLDKYSAETGVKVNLVTGKGDALLTRLKTEGRNSPADVLITTDAGRLYRAHQAGVLQPITDSPTLTMQIPAHLPGGLVRAVGTGQGHRVREGPGKALRAQHLREPGGPEVERPHLHPFLLQHLHWSPTSPARPRVETATRSRQ
jgi:hypothetical protein